MSENENVKSKKERLDLIPEDHKFNCGNCSATRREKSPSPEGEGRGEGEQQPIPELTYKQFKNLLAIKNPKSKTYTRRHLRKQYRAFQKDRKTYNQNLSSNQ